MTLVGFTGACASDPSDVAPRGALDIVLEDADRDLAVVRVRESESVVAPVGWCTPVFGEEVTV